MNHAIAHSDDLTPRNIWILRTKLFGHATGCLPDDLQSTNDCILKLHISQEIGSPYLLEIGPDHSC